MQDLLDTLAAAAQVELSLTNKTGISNGVTSNSTSPRATVAFPSTTAVGFGSTVARTARRSVSPKAKYLEENPSPYYVSLSQPNREPRFYPNPQGMPITHPHRSMGGGHVNHGEGENERDNGNNNNNGEIMSRNQSSRSDQNPTTATDSSDANDCHSPGFGTSPPESENNHEGERFSHVQRGHSPDPGDGSDVTPCDRNASAEVVAENSDEAGSSGSNRRRRTAAGVRAQELAAAKFAGMRTAAAAAAAASQGEGKADASATVSSASSGKGLCSFFFFEIFWTTELLYGAFHSIFLPVFLFGFYVCFCAFTEHSG